MKKLLCAFLSAALLASSAVPAFAAETTDSTNTTPVLTEGTYAPNQVIVMFKDSAIDTDSVPKKQILKLSVLPAAKQWKLLHLKTMRSVLRMCLKSAK